VSGEFEPTFTEKVTSIRNANPELKLAWDNQTMNKLNWAISSEIIDFSLGANKFNSEVGICRKTYKIKDEFTRESLLRVYIAGTGAFVTEQKIEAQVDLKCNIKPPDKKKGK